MPTLEEEQAAFNEQLEDLVKEHRGEFVVFKSRVPVGFYPDYEAAYNAALAQFGLDNPFLVSQVEHRRPESVSLAWDAGVMFG